MNRILMMVGLGLIASAAFAQQAPPSASPWPAVVDTADGQVTLFQPQLSDYHDDVLSERAAVSVQLTGQQDPVFGAIWIQHHVSLDQATGKLHLLDASVTRTRFPNPDPVLDRAVTTGVGQYFDGRSIAVSLEQVQATLDTVHKEQAAAGQMQVDAPRIVFLDHPSVKLQYDGAPRLVQVDNSDLLRAANTPFFVALDPASRTYFLKGGGAWFAAPDPMGPFHHVGQVPDRVAALADAAGYQDPQQALPPEQVDAVEIVTATEPTELIWSNGTPQLSTIAGTGLLYVANTDSDVFFTIDNQQYFVLLSGRWYSAPRRQGPWAAVASEQLPDDFHRIPSDSPKAGVLVSVPGTDAAQQAVADAFVPQTAAVDVNHFDQPPVAYDGEANFQPIDGTDMAYAVNTDASVIFARGRYYACYNAVWYRADTAVGPWELSTSVPGEIYTIPPSCPIYPVRFVYVYGRSRDAIYFGYLPGYLGSYVYHGVVVYGTGYHYRPWAGHFFVARPDTFGYAARYDFFTGHWGFDFGVALGGGFRLVAVGGDRFHPDRGVWFGHGGFHPVYARDVRHIEVARRDFERDRQFHPAVAVNVFAHRADVRLELVHSAPAPRGVVEIRVGGHDDRGRPPEARPQERVAPRDEHVDRPAVRDEHVDRPAARDDHADRPVDRPADRPAARDDHPDRRAPVEAAPAEAHGRGAADAAPARGGAGDAARGGGATDQPPAAAQTPRPKPKQPGQKQPPNQPPQ